MSIIYCERWNDRFSKPINVLTEEEAYARHIAGKLYTAVSRPVSDSPARRAVEIRLEVGCTRVYFYDSDGRIEITYTFGRREERMFLEGVTACTYEKDGVFLRENQASRVEIDSYNEDGSGLRIVRDEKNDECYMQELQLAPDGTLDDFWEDVPRFGEYDSIARAVRSQPPAPFV
ncbi:hypothetical protein V1L54_14075 [Streptomyces sp. TRM 70361]|uniref:hypothetical protein n=1 Tax=Streptomyces sp. TRM 70361 TaxID=3116553 RepID=UPI002E7B3BD0|nr:hypothetical protein [Streptomyces sp. TRM 70361]MEE1940519.1 hypothetical protein [Streptomyces sp. TRM 70361]